MLSNRSAPQERAHFSGGIEVKIAVLGGVAAFLLAAAPGAVLAEDLVFTLTNSSSYAVKSF